MKRARSPISSRVTSGFAPNRRTEYPSDIVAILDAAVRAVVHASRIATEVQTRIRPGKAKAASGGAIEKTDTSPVTIADFAVQCFVTHYLSVATGAGDKLRLVAEEDTALFKEGGRDAELVEVAKLLNDHFPFAEVASIFPDAGSPSCFTTADVLRLLQRGDDAGGREGGFWVLDPIDGTKGFLRDAQYAIGLAYVDCGSPVLSAMCCPNLPPPGGDVESRADDAGYVFFASDSRSCSVSLVECHAQLAGEESPDFGLDWQQIGAPLRVAPPCALGSVVLCESYESAHRDGDAILPLLKSKNVLSAASPVLRLDSMSKYGLVARGDAHVYLRGTTKSKYVEKIWDHAPGIPIVLAAGGRVTDLHGKPLDFGCGRTLCTNQGVLAAPSGVHEGMIPEIAQLASAE